MNRRNLTIVIAAALAVSLCGTASAMKYEKRSPWMVNVGIGTGRGEFKDIDENQREYRDGAVPQIRFGRMLGSHLMLGIAYQGWVVEFDRLGETRLVDAKLRRSLQNLTLGVGWFPASEGFWSGLYVRGGGGFGWAGTAIVPVVEGEPQEHGERIDDHGASYFAEAGYEFWISQNAAAGLIASYNYLDIQGDIVTAAWFSSLNFTLSLYF
jgi:hypothetical protein